MKANNLLSQFGDHRQRVQSAITAVCEGRGILLVDDENRENEGDAYRLSGRPLPPMPLPNLFIIPDIYSH